MRETIARIESLDGPINAVTTRFFERALERSRGPLPEGPFRGVPFLLKDLNDLEGTRKTMGSRLFASYVSTGSSPHTQRTLDAGFVVLGKTNTPEFGLVATTESALLGPCHNPWNLARSAGGSSGGAGAAVAAGMLPMAQASDGGDPSRVLEPVTLGMAARFAEQPEGAVERAVAFFREYEPQIHAFFDDYDVLLTPVLRTPPIPLGTQAGTLPFDRVFDPMIDYVSYTPVWNAVGNAAMSVSLGWTRTGLPIGSQFVARLGGEGTLLALAYELEAAQPWAARRPAPDAA